ncbi:hypothetical protein PTTG_09440 [Puccinia triticina 1-1 BBBD Race 1]|uniref:Uncharacterized protein n=1 Tax=Puccinia triticina (isolate 1-1 / race 1 (BBBD)) TaxID=630390 RepID=A0A180GRD4_PUCT1|nr:hypothetical protein PTTG_09440 [Puccinia triticina 1-1 BBBD Race 1]
MPAPPSLPSPPPPSPPPSPSPPPPPPPVQSLLNSSMPDQKKTVEPASQNQHPPLNPLQALVNLPQPTPDYGPGTNPLPEKQGTYLSLSLFGHIFQAYKHSPSRGRPKASLWEGLKPYR